MKGHLLPRLISQDDHAGSSEGETGISAEHIILKDDRIYEHNIMRINYTTYDTQRSQDVIHTSTSHRDIMLLDDPHGNNEDTANVQQYRYARVIGIYHTNVIYAGRGRVDYEPRRMEFLWVRWFQLSQSPVTGWIPRRLDRVNFYPVTGEESFGFVDPSEILRGCHIIPMFSSGKRHLDAMGLSSIARDSLDWKTYYVNR